MKAVRGRVRRFGDDVDTDTITPSSILHLPPEELKKHAFEPLFRGFYTTLFPGDIIVAGSNFGCGSSREQATAVLRDLGINFLVCDSISRIYFRNCIALGVYPVTVEGVSSLFAEGDVIEIDLEACEVRNPQTGRLASYEPLSRTQLDVIEAGGILSLIKKLVERKKAQQEKYDRGSV